MESPNYYAIIPANVRYDNRLKPNEKLLFGEITSLTQKGGYCFASNAYFANLYNVDKVTISRWVSCLEKCGHIKNEIVKNGENQVIERKIFVINNNVQTSPPIDEIINTPLTKKSIGYRRNNQYPIDEKVKDNNTSINNTRINNNIPPISPKKILTSEIHTGVRGVIDFYENNIGTMANSIVTDIQYYIEQGVESQLIITCLNVAVDNNKRNWSYARGVLKNLIKQGIQTQNQYELHQKESIQQTNSVPPKTSNYEIKANEQGGVF